MASILIPGLPEAAPAAEPWPVDDHTIRVNEMFARRLDTEFSAGVRGLLHDPETESRTRAGLSDLYAGAVETASRRLDRRCRRNSRSAFRGKAKGRQRTTYPIGLVSAALPG